MKLELVQAEDWTGLYKDGKLIYEGHDVPAYVIVEQAKGDVYSLSPAGDSVLTETGYLPKSIDTLKERGHIRWSKN